MVHPVLGKEGKSRKKSSNSSSGAENSSHPATRGPLCKPQRKQATKQTIMVLKECLCAVKVAWQVKGLLHKTNGLISTHITLTEVDEQNAHNTKSKGTVFN